MYKATLKMTPFKNIMEDFEMLDDWEDRYRYLIELGQTLEPLSDEQRTQNNKVRGCVSQVWLDTKIQQADTSDPILVFNGDSDAHIVSGLIAVLFSLFSGKHAQEILTIDARAMLKKLALEDHLTPQRSNGLAAMIKRIKQDASDALTKTQVVLS